MAQLGIHVEVVGRSAERGEKTVAKIRAAGGKADFISSDLRDASSARAVAKRAAELGNGHVDILMNSSLLGAVSQLPAAVPEQPSTAAFNQEELSD